MGFYTIEEGFYTVAKSFSFNANDEGYFTDLEDRNDALEVLETVFENGKLIKEYTFDEVRANASMCI